MGTYGSDWQHLGYSGCGNVVELLDSLQGRTVIVAGNAKGVFEEVKAVTVKADFDAVDRGEVPPELIVFAVNDVGVHLPRVHHMVSLHADKLHHWAALRMIDSWRWKKCRVHSNRPLPGIDFVWDGLSPLFALSGYFAMQIAYLMGAEQIILCGCPGDGTPRFFEIGPRSNNFDYHSDGVVTQLEREMVRLPEFKAKVRSTSGFTKEFFGGV